MSFDTHASRARYRAAIHPRYNAWLHAGFVLSFGVAAIGFFWSRAEHIQPWEWLAVPLALVFHNWVEYMTHKHLGHHKHAWARMFYERHTGDHHSFFADGQMFFESMRDWRVILFPAWLIVAVSACLFLIWLLLAQFNHNLASLFIGTALFGYLTYEILHACEHLPESHPVSRLIWVRHMRKLHELHHRRDLMQTSNFNIVFPLWDWLFGTLQWEVMGASARAKNMVKIVNHIDIERKPERILDYVSTVTRWHEWHPYPVTTQATAGPLRAGSAFKYLSSRAGQLSWVVVNYVPDRSWEARAQGNYGLELFVTYECLEAGRGTRFVRTLEYRFSSPFARLLDRMILRRRIRRDSLALLDRLRDVAREVIPS
jgi:hypothetical protein